MAKDGSSAMYINGTKVCASDDPTGQKLDSLAALMNQTGAQFRIGSNSIWPDPGLDGRVDNVRIYSKVLAEADFASIPWTVKEEAVDDTVEFPEFGEHGLVGDFYLVNESSFNFTEYQSTWIDSNIASTNMESTLLTRHRRAGLGRAPAGPAASLPRRTAITPSISTAITACASTSTASSSSTGGSTSGIRSSAPSPSP